MKRITFVLLCLEGAILSFNVAAAAALVPSIAKDFAISPFIAGKIVWIYMLTYGTSALIYGPLLRNFELKRIKLVCFFLFSLANLIAGISININTLFVARFFMGVFGASVIPLTLILIAHSTLEQERGKLVGTFFSTTFVASLLGLFLSGMLIWRIVFLIPAILGFMLWIIIYFYLPTFPQDAGSLKVNYLGTLSNRAIIFLFIYIFFISFFYHGIQQWLAVYFSARYNFSQFLTSMLITLTSLSGIFGEVIGGWLADFLGRLKTINLGLILMVLSVFLLLFKAPLIILGVMMMIWGLGWTFNHAGLSTLITDLPQVFLNEAASLNSSVRFLSGGLGAVLGGILLESNFNLGFIIFGVCLLGLLFFSKRLIGTPLNLKQGHP